MTLPPKMKWAGSDQGYVAHGQNKGYRGKYDIFAMLSINWLAYCLIQATGDCIQQSHPKVYIERIFPGICHILVAQVMGCYNPEINNWLTLEVLRAKIMTPTLT